MGESGRRFDEVRAAELALLAGEVRRSPATVAGMLREDFVEIGRSGRHWSRGEIIAELAREGEHSTPTTTEWTFNALTADLVLITYRLETETGTSRHSSIWSLGEGGRGPQLVFHQGTPSHDERDDVEGDA